MTGLVCISNQLQGGPLPTTGVISKLRSVHRAVEAGRLDFPLFFAPVHIVWIFTKVLLFYLAELEVDQRAGGRRNLDVSKRQPSRSAVYFEPGK